MAIADCVRIFKFLNRLITAIPLSPDSLDQCGILWILLNLETQIADVDHDRIVGSIIVRLVPHGFIEVLGGEDLPAVLYQKKQHGILRVGEHKGTAVRSHFLFCFIYPEMVEDQRLLWYPLL